MHHGESGEVGAAGRRFARLDVDVCLRPSDSDGATQGADEAVLNVGELSGGGGADSVDDD